MIRQPILLVCLFVCLTAWFGMAGDGTSPAIRSQLAVDEQTLKSAGVAIDGPGLIEYFRRRTPSLEEQIALKKRVQQLGSAAHPLRAQATTDLIRAGRVALPSLRDVAKSPDVELARRAQYCIGVIEQNTRLGVPAHAARVLAARNPEEAMATLFAYLPFADEGWVEEEIRFALKRISYTAGRAAPLAEKMLANPDSKRRGAAAWVVGASNDPEQRARVMRSLRDESAEVRFFAASSLLSVREPAAIPALIDLLTAVPTDLAWRAEDLLFRVAGDKGPAVWLDFASDNNGRKSHEAWESWWKENESKIDWKSIRFDEEMFGWTLIAENQRTDGSGRLFEMTKAKELRWQVKLQNPIDIQWLRGGKILVGDSRAGQILEIDTRGNVVWKYAGVNPTSIQRLPNGNTVASSYQKIIEINRDGAVVFSYSTQGHTYHVRKTPDNHYIWIDACGEIGEIDAVGTLIAKTKISAGLAWGSIERIRAGRYLVALGGVGKVQEIDMAGRVYWEKTVNNPNRAIRLVNGHTLVASHGDNCVYEFDANGNERWKLACDGKPFAAVRR